MFQVLSGKKQIINSNHIKYAESKNGIDWTRNGNVAIDFQDETESNIARSSVIKDNGIYKMWYSYIARGLPYRIGYAESKDCINWMKMFQEMDLMICYCS